MFDPRVGKFLSVDPLQKTYPYYTPYQFAGNMPIWAIDIDGLEEMTVNSVANVIKDIKGNIVTKPTVVNASASSVDAIPGVKRLNTGQVEVTPGLIGQKDPTFNTFTWQQVNGKDFIIKQSNTAIGQDAGGTAPPKTNLEQNNEDPLLPAGRTPVITLINQVDVKNQTLTRNINFEPGEPNFAADADRDVVSQVAANAPNSITRGKPVTTTNGNTTTTTQTTRQVRSIITVDLKTDKHDPNLQTSRYNLIKQQLINSGVPAKNIRRGTTQYDQSDASMGGNVNQTIFRVRTTRSTSTTGTSTTTQ
jgi:hypothetical protein